MLCKSFLFGVEELLHLSCKTDGWDLKYLVVWTYQSVSAPLPERFCIPPKDLRTSPAFQTDGIILKIVVADIMYWVCVCALTWAVNSSLAQSKVCKEFWLPNLWLWNIYCTFQVQVCLQEWILQGGNCYGQSCEENCKSYIFFMLHVWMLGVVFHA
jgi:hypothetical protein